MTPRAAVTGLIGGLLALAVVTPAWVAAADPVAKRDAVEGAAPVAPTVIDVLANDGPGAATPDRPLMVVGVGAPSNGTARTDGRSVVYDPTGCFTGVNTFSYTISDGVATASEQVAIRVTPGATPVTDPPQAAFVTRSTVGRSVPVRVSWCGVPGAGASVKGYRVTESTNGGTSFAATPIVTGTATSVVRAVAFGTPYAWRASTTDTQARTGIASSLVSRVTRYQERSSAVAYSAGWRTVTSGRSLGDREAYASRSGATATLTVRGARQFAIVSSTGATRGAFHVYLDGKRVTTTAISQRTSSSTWRRVLYVGSIPGDTSGTHTVQLRTTSAARVGLDAFLVLSGRRDQALSVGAGSTPRTYGSTATVTASASSGLPVVLSVATASWPVCSLTGSTLAFHGTGTCSVVATQFGDATWNARTTTVAIAVGPKPLAVNGITASDKPYDGLSAASLDVSGALPVGVVPGDDVQLETASAAGTFATPDAGPGRPVTVTGLSLAGEDAGRYVLQPPSLAATITKATLTVTADDHSIAYADPDPAFTATYGGFAAGEDPAVLDTPPTCSPTTAARDVAGSPYAIACSGAADGNYAFAYVPGELAVTKADQSVAFDGTAPEAATVGGSSVHAATATSGLPATIEVDGATTNGACSLVGGTVHHDAAGTCVLVATQPGDGNWHAAPPVLRTFEVSAKAQSIAFEPLDDAVYGHTFEVAAVSTSGLPVAFASATPGTCAVSDATVTLVATGTCTIRATQAGDAVHEPATPVDRSFAVLPRPITVTAVDDARTADGTTASAGVPVVTAGSVRPGDAAAFVQSFATAEAGTGILLTPAGTVTRGMADVTDFYDVTWEAIAGGTIMPGPAAALTVRADPTAVAGVPFGVTVAAWDAFGNVATGYAGTVRLNSGDPAAVLPADRAFGPADAGVVTFEGVILGTPGTQTLTATDTTDAALTGSTAVEVAPIP